MRSNETYLLEVAGLERRLPVVPVAPGLSIACFVLLGDVELTETAAEALSLHPLLRSGSFDVIVCPEAKAIPLAHALARRLGLGYVVLRKSRKAYMSGALSERTKSITTDAEQELVLDGPDAEKLRGKRACLLDDVVSTGGSLDSMERLVARAGCSAAARAAVLLEEGGHDGAGLAYLAKLPVFRSAPPSA